MGYDFGESAGAPALQGLLAASPLEIAAAPRWSNTLLVIMALLVSLGGLAALVATVVISLYTDVVAYIAIPAIVFALTGAMCALLLLGYMLTCGRRRPSGAPVVPDVSGTAAEPETYDALDKV